LFKSSKNLNTAKISPLLNTNASNKYKSNLVNHTKVDSITT